MKIAIVSDDNQTISQHLGRAENYIVISLEQENIIERKTRPKPGHCRSGPHRHANHSHGTDPRGNGFGPRAKKSHHNMYENITDCDLLLTRGMGRGAYMDLHNMGIKPIVTNIADIEEAIQAIVNGTIIDHAEKLH